MKLKLKFIISPGFDKAGHYYRAKIDIKPHGFRLKGKDLEHLTHLFTIKHGAEKFITRSQTWVFRENPAKSLENIEIELKETGYRKRGAPRKMKKAGIVETNDGTKGGILKGNSHKKGGIKAVISDADGKQVELEEGEAILSKKTMESQRLYDFKGNKLTAKEIASKLNIDNGGNALVTEANVVEMMEKGGMIDEKPGLYTWKELPDILKVPKHVNKVKISENSPKDKGFVSLFSPFVANDELRPVMNGAYFDDENIVASDSHRLINFPAKSKFKGIYQLKTGQQIKGEYPNYMPVVPMLKNGKQVDIISLKTYTETALNFSNQYSKLIVYKINDNSIGFKGDFLIDILETFLKLGHKELYIYNDEPSKATIFTALKYPDGHNLHKDEFFVLLMPMMVNSNTGYGARDFDFEWVLDAYFDFDKNTIISENKEYTIDKNATATTQGNLTIEQQKILAALMKKHHNTLPILDYAAVIDSDLYKSDLETTLIIKKCGLPDGLYRYSNALLLDNVENIDDFPTMPEGFVKIGETSSKELKEKVETAQKFTSNDELRPVMTGILFDFEENTDDVEIVASDSTLLSLDSVEIDSKNTEDFIFPSGPFVNRAIKLFENGNTKIYVSKEDSSHIKYVKLQSGNIELITMVIEGEYPKYNQIIPSDYEKSAAFDKKELLKILPKKISELKNSIVSIKKQKGSFKITIYRVDYYTQKPYKSTELSSVEIKSYQADNYDAARGILLMPIMGDVHTIDQDFDIVFNANRLNDVLRAIKNDLVNFYWSEPSRGAFFNAKEEAKKNKLIPKKEKLIGGLADKMTIEDIAKKHDKALGWMQEQLEKGIKIELEHTTDKKIAEEIAMDHLTEFPDYYIRLEKMEEKAISEKEEKKEIDTEIAELPELKNKYSTKEIAAIIRQKLKEKFPNCTFSVTKDVRQIKIALMTADFNPVTDKFKENKLYISNLAYRDLTEEGLLSEAAKEVFLYAQKIADHYNWDRSDSMTDYFDVNFYLTLTLGKWDKPFKIKNGHAPNNKEQLQAKIDGFKVLLELAETKQEKEKLQAKIDGFETLLDIESFEKGGLISDSDEAKEAVVSKDEYELILNKQEITIEPELITVDWGSGKGQGKRIGKKVSGAMSDPPKGKKVYKNYFKNLPDYNEIKDDLKILNSRNREDIKYLKFRSAGYDHESSIIFSISGSYEKALEILEINKVKPKKIIKTNNRSQIQAKIDGFKVLLELAETKQEKEKLQAKIDGFKVLLDVEEFGKGGIVGTNLNKEIERQFRYQLPEGYYHITTEGSKSSTYFYCGTEEQLDDFENGKEFKEYELLKFRLSNHDAMTGRSWSHEEVIMDYLPGEGYRIFYDLDKEFISNNDVETAKFIVSQFMKYFEK